MMKAYTKNNDSLFEKNFAKYLFNKKKTLMSDKFNKNFSIPRYSPLLEK